MDFKDFATILIAMLSLAISILAFGQQWLSSIQNWKLSEKANDIANQANTTADRALGVTLHDHKVKITPIIVANCYPVFMIVESPEDDLILITIKNKTHAKVELTSIKCRGLFELQELQTYPITLYLNGEHQMFLQFKTKKFREIILKRTKVKFETSDATDDLFPDLDDLFSNQVQKQIHSSGFEIDYRDALGTEYQSLLHFSEEIDTFTGEPVEIHKTDS